MRGDLDGFFGLAIDNLIQFLLIFQLSVSVCGLPAAFVIGRILPGAALSVIIGNLYYAWLARRVAAATGRDDVTALPFGINTVSLFAFVFFVIEPTFRDWASRPGVSREQAATVAWEVGLVACLLSGIIEALGGLVAERVRRATPRAALLATLAGIAVGFISMEFVLRTFAVPLVALVPLAILLARYLGHARLPFGLPGGLCAVAVGTALAWGLRAAGLPSVSGLGGDVFATLGFHPPLPAVSNLLSALGRREVWDNLAIIVPMGLINVLGALQCVESAEAEGDRFPTGPSLVVNGVSSMLAAVLGSCYPTTIYIGHPGWKRMGARTGYSILNAVFFAVVAFTGLLGSIQKVVPIEAGMAILVWIAVIIVSQAFQATPTEHAPAVVLGLLPGLAAWGWLMIELAQTGLKIGGKLPWVEGLPGLIAVLDGTTLPFIAGLLSLRSGFMFSAMFLAAIAVQLIEGRLRRAALWSGCAALASLIGIMHSYTVSATGVQDRIQPGFAWPTALGYAGMACVFLLLSGRRAVPASGDTA